MAQKKNYVKRFNVEKRQPDLGKTVNYDFSVQDEPMKRMGDEGFANMPSEPVMRNFSRSHNYRSGVVNDFSCGLEDESGIHENKVY